MVASASVGTAPNPKAAENPLMVFISSVMDPNVEDLTEERETARSSVDALAVTRSWTFEHSPASADAVDRSYLQKVDDCDMFILILGSQLTDPVEDEYVRAFARRKRRFVFVKHTSTRSTRAAEWLAQRSDVKWKEFDGSADLADHLRNAIIDELIKSHRSLHLSPDDFNQLATQLRSEPISFMVRTVAAKELSDVTQTFPEIASRYPDFDDWVNNKRVEIAKGGASAYVASYGADNAGFALVSDKGPRVRKISTLFIKPYFQTRGIGPRLLYAVIEQAARDGIEKLYITLSDDLRPSLEPLLARFAFSVEGVSAHRYGDAVCEWVWSKRLVHGRLRPPQLHSFVRRLLFQERGYEIEPLTSHAFTARRRYGPLGGPISDSTSTTLVVTAEKGDVVRGYKSACARAQALGVALVFVSIESLPMRPDIGTCLDAFDLEQRFFPLYVETAVEGLILPIQEQFARNLIPESAQLQMVLPTRVQLRTDNVYYRYPSVFARLARGSPLFFYETQRRQGQSQLIGEGRLLDYAVDAPQDLLGRFGNLGVYTLREVDEHAGKSGENKGKALALHFDWYREAVSPLSLAKLKPVLPSFNPSTARRVTQSDAIELRRLAGWNVDTLSSL